MKKLLIVILTLTLLVICGCGSPEDEYLGRWYPTYGERYGEEYDVASLDFNIVLYEENKAEVYADTYEPIDGVWEIEDGYILIDAGKDELAFEIEEDRDILSMTIWEEGSSIAYEYLELSKEVYSE